MKWYYKLYEVVQKGLSLGTSDNLHGCFLATKELLENLQAQSMSSINSVKTYNFSTLYTTIPHSKLKSRLKQIIIQAYMYKNGKRLYKYIVANYD